MTKLSVNETKWSILLARTRALIFLFRFEYLISGSKVIGTLEKRALGLLRRIRSSFDTSRTLRSDNGDVHESVTEKKTSYSF